MFRKLAEFHIYQLFFLVGSFSLYTFIYRISLFTHPLHNHGCVSSMSSGRTHHPSVKRCAIVSVNCNNEIKKKTTRNHRLHFILLRIAKKTHRNSPLFFFCLLLLLLLCCCCCVAFFPRPPLYPLPSTNTSHDQCLLRPVPTGTAKSDVRFSWIAKKIEPKSTENS